MERRDATGPDAYRTQSASANQPFASVQTVSTEKPDSRAILAIEASSYLYELSVWIVSPASKAAS